MIIAVIDGMGGGIGAQIVEQLREAGLPPSGEIIALGTNAVATDRMMRSRADRGASGENAIRFSIRKADLILGPIGIAVPHAMLGEITPGIATAVAEADGHKLLIPLTQPHFEIVGVESMLLREQIEAIIARVRELVATGGE